MPISRAQFNLGLDNTKFQILCFLAVNPNQAFEVYEIAEALENCGPSPDLGTALLKGLAIGFGYKMSLEDLVQQGLVKKKVISGKEYYCSHQEPKLTLRLIPPGNKKCS